MRRNWLVAAIVLGIAAIAAAALIARLKDDSSGPVPTAAWADSVCTSLSDWRSAISSIADVGGGTLTPESLGEKLGEAEIATVQLVSELKALRPPHLDAGDELKQNLDSAAAGLDSSFRTLKQGAQDAAAADSPAAFIQALAALAPAFQSLLDQIGSTVSELRHASVGDDAKAELEAAFAGASCQQLRADS